MHISVSGDKYVLVPTGKGKPRVPRYIKDVMSYGRPLDNVWLDIDKINNSSTERIGYPTQKPEALLERIIKASSNEGDIVLDAFCGGGTTPAVASRLNRKFIAIDKSRKSVEITNERLCKQEGRSNYDIVWWNSEKYQN